MKLMFHLTGCLIFLISANAAATETRTLNNGNLVLQDIPPIPQQIKDDLNRYQNTRSAAFLDWTIDGSQMFINTRFGNVRQIHRVSTPGGSRYQLTFFDEPVGNVARQPEGPLLAFTMDSGGSENAQIFVLDPETGEANRVSDGQSRNGTLRWDRQGRSLAYQSTRRNGRSNDIWIMNPDHPEKARMVLEATDGSWWGPVDFSADAGRLLALNYISASISRALLLDLDSGKQRVLAGETRNSMNIPVALDHLDQGFFLVSDRESEFRRLAWQPIDEAGNTKVITGQIEWDVKKVVFSTDRKRGAFTVNAGGTSRLYLLDGLSLEYRQVDNVPTGLIGNMAFSPDNSKLALSLNTAKTPTDTFVLKLGETALEYSGLERWTYSEVGGLDTTRFIEPELVEYPTFDKAGTQQRMIPAFIYKPDGPGPHPVVISIHGGPEGQSRPGFSSTYQMWLNKLGVAVVVPNVRGSSGYGKTWLSLDNDFKREDSVRDIGALLDWIATQKDLDKDRIAVFGGSYGGYMVLASAVHYSNRLKAAVDIVGISNFVTFLENTKDYRRDLRRVEYGDERDPEMRAFLQKISPLNNVGKIGIPLFVVQGQNDPRVPVTEAEQIVAALRGKEIPVWYMNALNEGHGYRKKENRDLYQQAVVLFLRQYLLDQKEKG